MKLNDLRHLAISLCVGIALSGCSTLDTIGNLNPFGGNDSNDITDDPDRISILELGETLAVSGTISPSEVVLPDPVALKNWPQAGGNALHSVSRVATVDGSLEKQWSKDFGKGSSRKGRILAPPVIADGRIFVMDADNTVRAISSDNGSKIWSHKLKVEEVGKSRVGRVSLLERVRDPLALSNRGGNDKHSVGGGVSFENGTVYATSGLGLVSALNAETGAVIWESDLRVPMHSAPTVSGGKLFAISDDNELFALNSTSGETLWTYQAIVEPARMLTLPAAAVIDDVVIAPFSSGELVALRVQNGGVLWQDSLSGGGRLTPLASLNDIASGPVIVDGYVIASAQSGATNAFDLRTGQRVWSQPAGTLSFPWVAGDFIYAVTTNGEVLCMSKIDGSVVWLTQLDSYKNAQKRKKKIAWSGPILVDDNIVVVSSRGVAVELDPFDGSIKREFKTGQDVFVPPVFADGTLYIVSDGAKITSYN